MISDKKHYTGVGLDPEVVEFLAELARETERTRSWLINAIVREKARAMHEERGEREAEAAEAAHQQPPIINI